ncbi:MAG: DEAD/DEAH box helicase [Planctomycetota bacterium]
MSETNTTAELPCPAFEELGLAAPILRALADVGYEAPTPIQARVVPLLLAGRSVVGQAQTGTGKTGAFAWPLLQEIDQAERRPQAMVLTPTRELAIQVAEAFQRYAAHLPGFHVLPIYGGQSYPLQLRPLKRGVHVVVGTPGRVMDHMRRGSLQLDGLRTLVLDEADEMLRMGFLEDVRWVLDQLPEGHRTALFSATLPPAICAIAREYLHDPAEVTIRLKAATPTTLRQLYRVVPGREKLEALTRLLESEPFDGMLVFVRTKIAASQVAEKLEARGYATSALSGDLAQAQRERVVARFRKGLLDILVATDVAARGLDLDRISHVVNFDAPNDPETYVHRIGRTGRAGRNGQAILFVTPRERRMLRSIERATGAAIVPMKVPTPEDIRLRQIVRFKERIAAALENDQIAFHRELVTGFAGESGVPIEDVAAALAVMARDARPLDPRVAERPEPRPAPRGKERPDPDPGPRLEPGKERFRIEIGRDHGVRPSQIVGLLTGETGLRGEHIGRIEIHPGFSTIDLPEGMPGEIFEHLQRARVCGRELALARISAGPLARTPQARNGKNGKGKKFNKGIKSSRRKSRR